MLTGCSEGYNIRNYVHQLDGINTHMAELRNSAVRRLKAMLSYMNQDNFMSHLKLDLWFRNTILYLKNPSLHPHTKKNNKKKILHSHVISYGYRQMQLFRALAGAWEFCIIYWWVSATYCSCWWECCSYCDHQILIYTYMCCPRVECAHLWLKNRIVPHLRSNSGQSTSIWASRSIIHPGGRFQNKKTHIEEKLQHWRLFQKL